MSSATSSLSSLRAILCFVFFVVAYLPGFAQGRCAIEKEIVRGDKGARLEAFLGELASKGFSGVVLVASKGEILLHKAYGQADREKGTPNTVNTRFEIASVTKVFTAGAILRLEMDGKLRAGDALGKHLGAFPSGKSGATIHHLLTHTAGLVQDGATLDRSSRDAFIQSVKGTPVESPPGEKYRYTNAGYSLLAAIVEKASGVSYEDYVRKNLFEPAGIFCADFRDRMPPGVSQAIGYENMETRIAAPLAAYVWSTRGAGGLIATVADLYRWDRALRDNAILDEAAKNRMFSVHVRDEGYGWHVAKTSRGTATQYRGGGMPGFESQFVRFPDEDAAIILVINTRQERFRLPAWRGLEEILFSKP